MLHSRTVSKWLLLGTILDFFPAIKPTNIFLWHNFRTNEASLTADTVCPIWGLNQERVLTESISDFLSIILDDPTHMQSIASFNMLIIVVACPICFLEIWVLYWSGCAVVKGQIHKFSILILSSHSFSLGSTVFMNYIKLHSVFWILKYPLASTWKILLVGLSYDDVIW